MGRRRMRRAAQGAAGKGYDPGIVDSGFMYLRFGSTRTNEGGNKREMREDEMAL